MSLKRCVICRARPSYSIPMGMKQVAICPDCLEELRNFLERFKPKPKARKKPLSVKRNRIKVLARLIADAMRQRKQLYASSFAWRFGFTRRELKQALEKYGSKSWVITRTPTNHVIIRERAAVEEEAAHPHSP